jgi:ketosteroid isomerase-like protein
MKAKRAAKVLIQAWVKQRVLGAMPFRLTLPQRDSFGSMSRENVETVQAALDDFNAGKIGSNFEAAFDQIIEFRDELGELDNRDDLVAYLKGFQEALPGLHAEWDGVRDLGDTLIFMVNQGGRGAASGAEVEQRFTWVMTFKGGRCIRWHIYADHGRALEAAGLQK